MLRQSAALAQQQAKERILIEYPFNSSRERSYPFCMSAGSVFTDLAETIGANVVRTAAYPEEGPVYHGDWISVLDPSTLLSQATALADTAKGLPEAQVNIVAQEVCMAIQSDGRALKVSNLRLPNTETIELKSTELARLVTGFHTIDDYIATNARREISGSVLELLRALYPKTWRYSRNENWTYKS